MAETQISPSVKVLLVEDNPGDRRLLEEMLVQQGGDRFVLECADQLSRTLERLQHQAFDLVLLDLGLPDSQGLDTLRKTLAGANSIPVVVLTGMEDELIGVQAVRAGAQDYLVKGKFTGDTLERSMRYAVERKKVLVQLEQSLREVRKLQALLPICAWCKRIRNDQGYWQQIESYLHENTGTDFTHSICPECGERAIAEANRNG